VRAVPRLANYTLAFALQLRRKHGKPQFHSNHDNCDAVTEHAHSYIFKQNHVFGLIRPLAWDLRKCIMYGVQLREGPAPSMYTDAVCYAYYNKKYRMLNQVLEITYTS
jgi:hypothetical protein